MLLSCGIIGVMLYYSLLIAIAVHAIRMIKKRPTAMLTILTIIAYITVGLINFNMIVLFPICWLIIGVSLGITENS